MQRGGLCGSNSSLTPLPSKSPRPSIGAQTLIYTPHSPTEKPPPSLPDLRLRALSSPPVLTSRVSTHPTAPQMSRPSLVHTHTRTHTKPHLKAPRQSPTGQSPRLPDRSLRVVVPSCLPPCRAEAAAVGCRGRRRRRRPDEQPAARQKCACPKVCSLIAQKCAAL